METLKIVTKEQALFVEKENKTKVAYYLFDEYEIHHNCIPPHSQQEWHYHQQVEEVIYILTGTLKVVWKQDTIHYQTVSPGDIVQVKQSIHTFCNEENTPCTFLVFRLVLEGKNKHSTFIHDKVVVEDIGK